MKVCYFIIVIILLIVSSCKKEDSKNYQTIYPLPYLPVYPGSFWKYISDKGDTVTYTTSDNYILDSFTSNDLGGMKTDPIYVPYWNGEPVYGYSFLWSDGDGQILVPYLKEEDKASWSRCGYKYCIDDIIVAKDTSLVVHYAIYNSVIVVKEANDGLSWGPPPGIHSTYFYYAKNVGLIKEINVDEINHDTIQTLNIIDYHINK